MPMDKSRIEGIGNDGARILRCPEGHSLQSWVARAGTCDGCHRAVDDGEEVMDCRRCNWYLCKACEATYEPPDKSIWGSFMSFMNAVGEDFEAAWAEELDEESQRAHIDGVTPYDTQAAEELIAGFCVGYREHHVLPDAVELEALWSKCSILYGCVLEPGPLAGAIASQLAWAEGSDRDRWQPRLRALCVLELLESKGAVGKEIFSAVVSEHGEGLVRRMLDVPECAEKAAEVLEAVEKVKAFQEACF